MGVPEQVHPVLEVMRIDELHRPAQRLGGIGAVGLNTFSGAQEKPGPPLRAAPVGSFKPRYLGLAVSASGE
jgi:hypothetical protein